MRKVILSVLAGIIFGVLASTFLSKRLGSKPIPEGYVCVIVKNQSKRPIKLLTLKHERGSIEVKGLQQGEQTNVIFKSPGENAYSVIAKFESGSTVASRKEYIEGGYRRVNTIFTDTIRLERNAY
ncbi:hypothetical protein [Hymenobacter guriensis]|uniref:DUF4198 domain-containing protein n=1 Tax=Hymenobacter guriensis TaxID=2793065 RepID=A0ABS0L254_9BACT|nr:hypothetical protein [Hymenobacter guriensis]MBG8554055.1 hypothetical protein [Hymenobacter guriensis]